MLQQLNKFKILLASRWKFHNRLLGPMGVVVAIVVGYKLFIYAAMNEDTAYWDAFLNNHQTFALPIPDQMDFAQEDVPVNDYDFRERLDKELLTNTYFQSQTLQYFKRANRWFPVFDPILEQYQIPNDFKYLAVIESGLTNVVSPAGAAGYWQLMKPTAEQYGLIVNEEIDERYDPVKSTHAACKYLKDAYEAFGNWTMVAASYNMGGNALRKQAGRQKQESYYDLYLNTETSRYLPRLLAVKEIMQNPRKYGFHFRYKDLYLPLRHKKVTIDSTVNDMVALAEQLGTTYRHLKNFNPWIKKNTIPNPEGKKITIAVPDPKFLGNAATEPYESLATPVLPLAFEVDQDFQNDTQTDTIVYTNFNHIVKSGEDLPTIAKYYKVSPLEIVQWNALKDNQLKTGQAILIKLKTSQDK